MADITPTQVNVVSGIIRNIVLGEAVTVPGQLLTYDTGAWMLAQAGGTTAQSVVYGMAMELGIKDDSISVVDPGAIVTLGITLAVGKVYYLSSTPGRISNLYGDLTSGLDHVTTLGIPDTTAQLLFSVLNSKAIKS